MGASARPHGLLDEGKASLGGAGRGWGGTGQASYQAVQMQWDKRPPNSTPRCRTLRTTISEAGLTMARPTSVTGMFGEADVARRWAG